MFLVSPRFNLFVISTLCTLCVFVNVGKIHSEITPEYVIDSLTLRLEQEKNDTAKLMLLDHLCILSMQINRSASIVRYANQLLDLAEKLNDQNYIGEAYNHIARTYKDKENLSVALKYYYMALEIAEKQKNVYAISAYNSNIGVVYTLQENDSVALDYFMKALSIFPDSEAVNKINIYQNIAKIYLKQKNYSQAIEYINKGRTAPLKNTSKKYTLEDMRYYTLMGDFYTSKEQYDSARICYQKIETINKHVHSPAMWGTFYYRMGSFYLKTGKTDSAIKNFNTFLSYADTLGSNKIKQTALIELSKAYEQKNDIIKAYEYFKWGKALQDSMRNTSKMDELVRLETAYKFEKEKKQLEEQQKEKQKSKATKVWILTSVFMLMVAFTAATFAFLFVIRKQKKTVESQKQELEEQKKIIEEKNKDVMDSIHYAERIQKALLREEEHVSAHLPEHFILFMPKDIVSGDFYWANEKQDYFYFAVVDCTGHGVPGAIMSMLGISFLNDIVLMSDLPSPAEVLNKLRERIVSELRQNDKTIANRDGMDISLCRLNLKTLELEWAGANNPLCLFRNGVLQEIKADKQPIGYHPVPKPFTNHVLPLQKGDCIYLYSDGYADQFGGPKGKKLTYKRLEALFTEQPHSMSEQKEKLKNYFVEWKGALEQIDDVCVVGVRV